MKCTSAVRLLVLALLVACSPVVETGEVELELETPAAFSISAGEPGHLALRNQGTAAVHLPMGTYVALERLHGNSWESLGPWFIADGTGPSFKVAPGVALENTIHPNYFVESGPGSYRFRYEIFRNPQLTRPLPLEQRTSAAFEVTE
jgi:hypothetical protein